MKVESMKNRGPPTQFAIEALHTRIRESIVDGNAIKVEHELLLAERNQCADLNLTAVLTEGRFLSAYM